MSEAEIEAATARAARARTKLGEGLVALKERLLPRTIARQLVQATRDKAADAATAGVDAAKARPGLAVGVAALAALFLARKPIARAISHDDSDVTEETGDASARSPTKPSRKARR